MTTTNLVMNHLNELYMAYESLDDCEKHDVADAIEELFQFIQNQPNTLSL